MLKFCKMYLALNVLMALSTFSPTFAASALREAQDQVRQVSEVDASVLNEAAKIILDDNRIILDENNNSEDLQQKYREMHIKPTKTTKSHIPITPGEMMVVNGKVTSHCNDHKKIEVCWYFDDAPAEIKRLALEVVEKSRKDAAERPWLEKLVLKKILNQKDEFYINIPCKKGTYSRCKTHCMGNGNNLSSAIWCNLELKDERDHLPSYLLTELLEAHIKAKLETEKQQ